MKKEHQIILVGSDNSSKIAYISFLNNNTNNFENKRLVTIFQTKDEKFNPTSATAISIEPQHIYVLSNDAVYEGEWCFEMHNGKTSAENPTIWIDKDGNQWYLRQMNMNCSANDPECKKIIATTNIDITNNPTHYKSGGKMAFHAIERIPNLTDEFVQEYCKFLLDSVWVDYEGSEPKLLFNHLLSCSFIGNPLDDYDEMRKLGLSHEQCSLVTDYINIHYKQIN